jgi:hypothetical protein
LAHATPNQSDVQKGSRQIPTIIVKAEFFA